MRVLLSTLRYIQSLANNNEDINNLLSPILLPFADATEDQLVKIKGKNRRQLALALNSILQYPQCQNCHLPVCGNGNVCSCEKFNIFRLEKELFELEIEKSDEAIDRLANAAFRPLRNSFGFGAGVFGGINGVTAAVAAGVTISASISAAICIAAALPAFLAFAYVYQRGAREEKQIINDCYADCFDHAVRMHYQHIQSVRARQHDTSISNIFMNQPVHLPKPKKEKRGLLGNPLSHFIITTLAVFAICAAIILKVGVLAGLASNPIGWGIAATLAIGVGCYFAYNRYQYLKRKIECDAQLEALKHQRSILDRYSGPRNTMQKVSQHLDHEKRPLLHRRKSNPRPTPKRGGQDTQSRHFMPYSASPSGMVLFGAARVQSGNNEAITRRLSCSW